MTTVTSDTPVLPFALTVGITESGGIKVTMSHGPVLASVIIDPDEQAEFVLGRVAEMREPARAIKAQVAASAAATPNGQPLGVARLARTVKESDADHPSPA